jgi:cytochrome c oxidase assembly protein subunit 11
MAPQMSQQSTQNAASRRRNTRTGVLLSLVVVGMIGLSFASVPLYDLFCRVTGYGGTTRVAAAGSEVIVDRQMVVRFDGTVNKALSWRFVPEVNKIRVKVGETSLAAYHATNTGDAPVVGTATFNVTPDKMGQYFNKIECFCFTEQVLLPGQTVTMPVSFFIDPAIMEDRNLADVTTVTLSYTFFKADDQSALDNQQISQLMTRNVKVGQN